ncbi:uncharacterized protein BO80DRAFT_422629 [Aspergillus ibericus CBS 121593]|uniref:Zn(2)-C6 fungal-type domain-containing protein n=1 Tax=Aspergillus ibericus CBS 121593 TaxID=1448316 RepID=A0A395H7T1_9EURO|nr:hypothetical protein BO80DRAFT_422629 [Aspergillus ibericus CBS 121593]RAL03686.1 hypothetical protein BO80DRAFT_422629 [Aspergillus ibericus CBS 121593]
MARGNRRRAEEEEPAEPVGPKPPNAPLKLRLTCDRCMSLKVRCDKRKPSCERCAAAGAECIYSPFRWRAKSATGPLSARPENPATTWNRSLAALPEDLLGNVGPEDWTSDIPRLLASHDWRELLLEAETGEQPTGFDASWMEVHPKSVARNNVNDGDGDCDGDGDGSGVESIQLTELFPTHRRDGSRQDEQRVGLSSLLDSNLDYRRDRPSEALVFLERPPRSVQLEAESPCSPTCRCITLAFTALYNTFYSEASSRGPNACDNAVKVNRIAVQHLHQFISCNCGICVRDPTALFLATTLTPKILARYNAMFTAVVACQSPGGPDSPWEPGPSPDLAFVAAIQVDDLPLDRISEKRMKVQFLLCEVQKLSRVLTLLRTRAVRRDELPVEALYQCLSQTLNRMTSSMTEYCVGESPTLDVSTPSSSRPASAYGGNGARSRMAL